MHLLLFVTGTHPMHMLVDTLGDSSRVSKVYTKGRMWTVGASNPPLQTLQSLQQRGHRVICCGKSLSHIIGLKSIKDATRFQLDHTIHDSKVSISTSQLGTLLGDLGAVTVWASLASAV